MIAFARKSRILRGALWFLLFSLGYVGTLAWAAESHQVVQRIREFNLKELTVATGDTVNFINDDEFIHQIYVESRRFNFDSPESAPGTIIELKFTAPGSYEILCHIHPKMLLHVTVQ